MKSILTNEEKHDDETYRFLCMVQPIRKTELIHMVSFLLAKFDRPND